MQQVRGEKHTTEQESDERSNEQDSALWSKIDRHYKG
jgi:hypothetical protein